MPWFVQPDHAAVMIYPPPRTPMSVEQERLYADLRAQGDGTTITCRITVNGVVTVTKTPTNGAVVVVVTVVSQTVLTIGNDPANVAATCGTNTVVATGMASPGGAGTSTGTFNLVCTTTTTTKGGLALTGANVLRALLVALALIVIGALLVIFQRRRRQTI